MPPPPPEPPAPPPPPDARDATRPSFLGTLTATPGPRSRGRRRVTFGLGLSEAATVRVVVTRSATGGRGANGRCLASKPGRPRCTRQVAAGSASRALTPSGSRRLSFTFARPLGKGSYRATLTATDEAGNRSATRIVRFRVR
jgi:hypothetical protein